MGREREVAEVRDRLTDTRLLTLTGPGGCGKSRLALAVASELVESFEDGAWWMALASLSNPDLLPQAVASAIKVREVAGRTLIEALVEYLKIKDLLLILDTCGELLGWGTSSLCPSLFLLPFPTEHKGERERHLILSLAHGGSYLGRTGASSMVRSATRSARMPPGTSCTTRMDTCS